MATALDFRPNTEPGSIEASAQIRPVEAPLVTEITPAAVKSEPGVWKVVRLAIALPLLLLSGAAMLPFAMVPVSSQGVVNARLSDVRAPIEGNLQDISLETGDIVNADEVLAMMRTRHGTIAAQTEEDARTEQDMEVRAADLQARLTANQQELARIDHDAQSYANHVVSDLELRLKEATRDHESANADAATLTDQLKRDSQAFQEHLISRTVLDDATEKLEEAGNEEQADAERLEQIRKQIEDAKAGYVGGAGDGPAPAALAERDQITQTVTELTQEKQALDAELRQSRDTAGGREHALAQAVAVRSPVSGIIWSREGAPTQGMSEGDDLFRVADAASIHVEVWIDRRYGPQISIGDTVLVYLSGMGRELTGRVISFQGTSRRRLDEEINAIDLQPVDPDQYHVTIELDPADRKAIYIGQAAKVIFPGSKGTLRAKIYYWLAEI